MAAERVSSGRERDLLSAELIAERGFAVARRGFERSEVQEFLRQVAGAVRSLQVRLEEAEEARQVAEHRALHPVITEEVLMTRVGEETAAILRQARASAVDLRTRAGEEAAQVVEEAQQRAGGIRGEAEAAMAQSIEEASRSADEIRTAAVVAAEQLGERARQEAEAIQQMAEQERKLTIEGAQSIREKILDDLTDRRRAATVQIEQLRAGRERLVEAYGVVRRTLEEVDRELQHSDAEARAAADQVGRDWEHAEWTALRPDLRDPVESPVDTSDRDGPAVDPVVDQESAATPGGSADAAPSAVRELDADLATWDEPGHRGDASAPPDADSGMPVEPAAAGTTTRSRRRVAPPRPPSRPNPRRREAPGAATPEAEAPPGAEEVSGVGPLPPHSLTSGLDEATQAVTAAEDAASPHVVTAPEPGLEASRDAPAGPETDRPSVDGLFERLRAGREDAVTQARQVLSAEAPMAEAPTTDSPTGEPPAVAGDDDAGMARSSEDEGLLERREAVLGDIEVILTRKLKRALQDEQNDLLDRLRNSREEPDAATLLGPGPEHRQRYIDASLPQLELAGRAGARFAIDVIKGGGRQPAPAKRPAKVNDLAADLATTLSDQVRRRVELVMSDGPGDDHSVLIEALGAAYREIKTQRVERTAGDQVVAAFSRGTWETAGDRVMLRWVVEDIDGPCADCDDNALAGALARHEGFPTGQAHPPAHAGCRCLLAPDLAFGAA